MWVINAFFVWYPLEAPWSEFAGETDSAAGISALVGATIFEFGSVLMMLEAVNENRTLITPSCHLASTQDAGQNGWAGS